jgi:hypothetical protein
MRLLGKAVGQAVKDPPHRSFHDARLDTAGKHLQHLVVVQQRVMMQPPEWGL